VTVAINWPHGLQLSPDQSRLLVTDTHTRWVESFEIQGDGSLANGKHYCRLEARNDAPEVDAGGMAFDTEGFLYVATSLGVQVFDRGGRVAAIIDAPGTGGVSAVLFGGTNREWLYVTDGDKMYRRLSKRRGAASAN
jgi:sugar lactone lactonase YvrE